MVCDSPKERGGGISYQHYFGYVVAGETANVLLKFFFKVERKQIQVNTGLAYEAWNFRYLSHDSKAITGKLLG